MEGWLQKRSGGHGIAFHRRWVEVDAHNGKLAYYDNERKKADDPKGIIDLWAAGTHAASSAADAPAKSSAIGFLAGKLSANVSPDLTFAITAAPTPKSPAVEGGKRIVDGAVTFVFAAETARAKAEWLAAIRSVIENNPEIRMARQKALRAMGLTTTATVNAVTKWKSVIRRPSAKVAPAVLDGSTDGSVGGPTPSAIASASRVSQLLMGARSSSEAATPMAVADWSVEDHEDEVHDAGSFVMEAMKQKQKARELLNGVMISSKYSQLQAGAPIIFRASTIVRAPAESVFDILSDVLSMTLWNPTIHKAELVETVNDTTGIYHIVFGPGTGIPPWLPFPQRDACIVSVGIANEDGSFTILQASTEHPACPPDPEYVRAEMLGTGYTITRRRPEAQSFAHPSSDCLLTQVSQIDYKLPAWFTALASVAAGDESTRTQLDKARVATIVALREYVEQGCFMDAGLGNEAFAKRSLSSKMSRSEPVSLPYESAGIPPTGPSTGAEALVAQADSSAAGKVFEADAQAPTASETSPVAVPNLETAGAPVPAAPPKVKSALPAMLSRMGGSMPGEFWSDPDVTSLNVRGKSYLTDKKKVRAINGSKMKLVGVDLFQVSTPTLHIASRPESVMQKHCQDLPFVFVVNLMVPGAALYNVACYYATLRSDLVGEDSSFGRTLTAFLNGTYEDQCKKFKLIPKVVQGSWIIKQAVGETPAILGKKLKMSVFKGSNYCEVDVDIGSSSAANSIMRLVSPATKSLVVDLAFLLEGQTPGELPEEILGACQFARVDLTKAVQLG